MMDSALPNTGQLLADSHLDVGLTMSRDADCETAHVEIGFGIYTNNCFRHKLNIRFYIHLYRGFVLYKVISVM